MVLAHRERLTPRRTQADLAAQRVRDFTDKGTQLGPLPSPGVYARHNAVDTPALLPDGRPAAASVSRVLAARGSMLDVGPIADDIDEVAAQLGQEPGRMPETGGKDAATSSSEEDVK
jgi:NADH-quinone oxidoreductase subunit J